MTRLILAAVAASLLCAAPAGATTYVSDTSRGITVDGDSANNKITVTETATGLVVEDTGSDVYAQGTCTDDGTSRATCPLPPAHAPVFVSGGDGDDEITTSLLTGGAFDYASIQGETGNDTIRTTDGKALISDGPGNDAMYGAGGDDYFVLTTNVTGDADVVRGGGGNDIAEYPANATTGVRMSADDQPDDGQPGEGDDIGSDIETLRGTAGPDVIYTARGVTSVVEAWAGNDEIHGSDANDQIYASDGDDVIYGQGGDDHIQGDAGNDTIDAGPGEDDAAGEAGDDIINTRDAPADAPAAATGYRDVIGCDEGVDTATVDFFDVFVDQCEHWQSTAPPTNPMTPPPPPPPTPAKPALVRLGRSVTLIGGKTVNLPVSRPAGADCIVAIRLLKGKTAYASTKATVKSGAKKTLKLKLNAAGRKAFKKSPKLKLTVMGKAGGGAESKLGTITLKRR